MKKLCILLAVLILCLSMPLAALADAGGPMIISVEARVINPNGARIFYQSFSGNGNAVFEEGLIPCGEEIVVNGEYTVPYGFEDSGLPEGPCGGVYYNDMYGYVSLADVASIGDFQMSDAMELSHPLNFYVYAENGIDVYSGPSFVYDKIASFPCGTELTATYGDSYSDPTSNMFYYVEHSGVSGWIFSGLYVGNTDIRLLRKVDSYSNYSGRLEAISDSCKILQLKETDDFNIYLYNDPASYEEPAPCKKGDVLNFKYYYSNYGDDFAYVDDNGVKGFVYLGTYSGNKRDFLCGLRDDSYIIATDELELYSELANDDSENGTVIPANSLVKVDASFVEAEGGSACGLWYRTEHDGEKAYLKFDDNEGYVYNALLDDGYDVCFVSQGSYIDMYAQADDDSEIVGTLGPDEMFYALCLSPDFDYTLVYDGEKSGWINSYDYYFDSHEYEGCIEIIKNKTIIVLADAAGSSDEAQGEEDASDAEEDGKFAKHAPVATGNGKKLLPTSMIIICCAAAAVLACTALVVILLIKKSKKKKAAQDQ